MADNETVNWHRTGLNPCAKTHMLDLNIIRLVRSFQDTQPDTDSMWGKL